MQRGFGLGLGGSVYETLLLPIILVAIIASVGWWAYGDYRMKARVKAGLALAAPAQAAVEKTFAAKGPLDFAATGNTGWVSPPPGADVQIITIARTGVITVRYTALLAAAGENQIQIVPVSEGNALDLSNPASAGRKFTWQCGGAAGKTTLPAKIRGDCR